MPKYNHFYGHSKILRAHCPGRLKLPILGHMQHGWTTGTGLGEGIMAEPWPKFIWAKRNLDHCIKLGFEQAIPIGAPFLYLPKSLAPVAPDPRSLLVIPFHGWEEQKIQGDMVSYARAIDQLVKDGFSPITVCLYWTEYENPDIREVFSRRGFEVVSLGHRDNNPNFLFKQRILLERHAYVTSNRVGTAGFYALACGCRFFLYGPCFGLSNSGDLSGEDFAAWQLKEFPELVYDNLDDHCARDIGLRELGHEFLRTPEQLQDLFIESIRKSPRILGRHIVRQVMRLRHVRKFLIRSK